MPHQHRELHYAGLIIYELYVWMCGFKLITSCLEYVARLPGSGVGFLVGSLCPLTAEIGHRASAKARLSFLPGHHQCQTLSGQKNPIEGVGIPQC